MFRKLVSNLAFSPALVGQLGFYAKRLRKEEATRRIGLIFTALALVVQSFAVFSPPESANAASPNNILYGGCATKECILSAWDNNRQDFRSFMSYFGIIRSELAAGTWRGYNSSYQIKGSDWPISFGRQSSKQRDGSVTVNGTSYYHGPLSAWGGNSWYAGLRGYSASAGEFAIMAVCGNLLLKRLPPPKVCPPGTIGTYPNCTTPPKMCTVPGKGHLRADDPRCKPDPVAKCESLKITKLLDNYQMSATSSVANGATVTGYVYTIKKDGVVVKTETIKSNKTTDSYTYTTKAQGSYTVELTVKTSLGDKTDSNCVKTFNVPAPEMCPQNPKLTKDSPECQPCPGDPTLWIKDEKCSASVVQTKTAVNITQGNVNASTTTAKASDKIMYTLEVVNRGKAPANVDIVEDLSDITDYASVTETGGGTYNADKKTLTWPSFKLEPGKSQTRMFTVQMANPIPAMGANVSDGKSYDCRMDNVFGNTVSINVDCPVQKRFVERTVSELPHTGPTENMIFAGATLAIVAYFYARSRQMKKEVRLIRRDFNAGTI